MITIRMDPSNAKGVAESILAKGEDVTVSDLDVIDELIKLSSDIQFIRNTDGVVLSHKMAEMLRYERGLDIR